MTSCRPRYACSRPAKTTPASRRSANGCCDVLSAIDECEAIDFLGPHWRPEFDCRRRAVFAVDDQRALGAVGCELDPQRDRLANVMRQVAGLIADDNLDTVEFGRRRADAL